MTHKEQEKPSTTKRARSRVPTFKTVEEEAAFWDTHSSTEFEDELEIVTDVKFVKAQPKKAISVRLEQEKLERLTQEAKAMGIGPSTLARIWILEHLRDNQDKNTSPKAS